MAATAKLGVDVVVNARGASKALADTGADIEKLEKTTKESSKGMLGAFAGFAGGAAFAGITTGVKALGKVMGSSIKSASDLNETTAQTGQIFGAAASDIERFAGSSATSMGLSKTAAMDAANSFATFGKAAGLTGQDLSTFSTDMVSLSGDLASFKNTTPEEAITAIGAALRGESEPIRKYGVLLDDATLKNRALAMGLISSTKEVLTPQQKTLAAQAEILAQTADAHGDFARTADGLANQQRIMSARWEDMQAAIGAKLLPVLLDVGRIVNDTVLPALSDLWKYVQDNIIPVVKDLAKTLTDKVAPGLDSFGTWVKNNIPAIATLTTALGFLTLALEAHTAATEINKLVTAQWSKVQDAAKFVMDANPIFLVIAAVLVLAAAIIYLWNNCETFRNVVTTVFEALKNAASKVLSLVAEGITKLGDVLRGVWEDHLQPVLTALADAFHWVWDTAISPVLGFIGDGLKVFGDVVKALWDNTLGPFGAFVAEIFAGLWAAAQPALELLADALRVLGEVVGWLWDTIISPIFGLIGDAVKLVFDVWVEYLKLAWDAVKFLGSVLSWLWENVAKPVFRFLGDVVTVFVRILTTAFDLAVQAVKILANVWFWLLDNVIRPVVSFIGDTIRGMVSTLGDQIALAVAIIRSLASWFAAVAQTIASIGAGLWNWVAGGVRWLWDTITGTWNDIVGFVTGLPGRLADAARGMWDGISGAFKTAMNFVIRGWNALEFSIPGFDLGPVHFSGFTLGVPDIPMLAAGGVVSRPTLAVVGEAGAEIVSPVPLLRRLIAEGRTATGGSTTVNYSVTVNSTGLGPDSPRIQRDVVDALRLYQRRNGPLSYSGAV